MPLCCPHTFNHYTLSSASVYQKMRLIHKSCTACVSFSSLFVCLSCGENFCEAHLLEHFSTCARSICYMPEQNIHYCFSCEKQILSFNLRTQSQLFSFNTLTQRFAKYRQYKLNQNIVLQNNGFKVLTDTSNTGTQTDLEPVQFVEPEQALSNNIFMNINKPMSLQEALILVNEQNNQLMTKQQDQIVKLTQQIELIGEKLGRKVQIQSYPSTLSQPEAVKENAKESGKQLKSKLKEQAETPDMPPTDMPETPAEDKSEKKKKKKKDTDATPTTIPDSPADMPPPEMFDEQPEKKKKKKKDADATPTVPDSPADMPEFQEEPEKKKKKKRSAE
ncbi:RING/FYVE/PHD-type [Hexamita inflata]|uniref:RING/FYVE/PHD-type n=1 Tax=Hexamita inflata TaxID=28002 RepID=A0AA86QTX4_9EUKA|nr:RING/FYVE/PHD-type [Hexamita inflata]